MTGNNDEHDRPGEPGSGRRTRLQSWPEAWVRALLGLGSVSPERRPTVLRDTKTGSQPTATYYVLLGISELIAAFAGVLAMIDQRVSPALPGAAIHGAQPAGWGDRAVSGVRVVRGRLGGAFLLLFANVLAILAFAAAMFIIAGFVTRAEFGTVRGLTRPFTAAAVGLLSVTALLTNYLFGMVWNIRTQRTITAVLDEELGQEPSMALVSVDFRRGDDEVCCRCSGRPT